LVVAMTHVPYRGGGSAITDLLGGQVQVFFSGVGTSIEYLGTGKVRALPVTTAVRLEALPDVPTVGDFVPCYEASKDARPCTEGRRRATRPRSSGFVIAA